MSDYDYEENVDFDNNDDNNYDNNYGNNNYDNNNYDNNNIDSNIDNCDNYDNNDNNDNNDNSDFNSFNSKKNPKRSAYDLIKKKSKKKKGKSITEEYFEYHKTYTEKFGKDRTVVLMQVGKFYEAYATETLGPNLKMLEELTEASIAHRGRDKNVIDIENPWMWGFPMLASLKYVGILIENGYRVVIIDQVTPKPNIRREVVAIHSPGTYLEAVYRPISNFVAVIYVEEITQKFGQQLLFVGMSAIDVSTGDVFVHESNSQLTDDKLGLDETNRFLNSISPKEIIIYKENLNKLNDDYMIEYLELTGKFYQIRDYNNDHNKMIYQKKVLEKVYPNRENMTSIIDTLGMSRTIYARKALVNLLIYLSDHLDKLVKGLSDPNFYLSGNCLILGNDAINQLNVIDNRGLIDTTGSVKFHNLLDVINKSYTPMGRRYIKFRLVSPYTDPTTINQIYDNVDAVLENDNYETIGKILGRIHDIERLFRKLSLKMLSPMQMVDFINSMCSVEELSNVLKTIKFIEKKLKISGSISIIKRLNKKFSDNINCERAKMCNLVEIKENIFVKGVYPELDELQTKIGDNHVIMNELLQKLNDMIKDPNGNPNKLFLRFNHKDGYFYQLTARRYKTLRKSLDQIKTIDLESTSINVCDFEMSESKNNVKLTLPFLREQTDDIDGLISEISSKTYGYYMSFIEEIHSEFGSFIEKIIDMVTKIDYYATIARVSRNYNYVRPVINDIQKKVSYIKTKNIRHPIVERIIEHEYVPHNIDIGCDDLKGMLIYGLNSAGKSVLMKAIGMSVIMAQAGFFVPAESFEFFPYKSLYTRITGNDNIFRGLSSYSLEIVELSAILNRHDKTTLVIGDEVCRGTEHVSGNAIVASTLLKLSDAGSSFIFATHLHELMELEDIKNRQNIKAFHLSVEHDEKTDKLIYDRILKPGSGERIYGITVAKYIIKDDAFIKKALEIKNILLMRDTESGAISTKKSRYNSDLLMDKCDMCGKRKGELNISTNTSTNKTNNKTTPKSKVVSEVTTLETHHINHQKDCENGFVKSKPHIKKNQIFNLMVLCQKCHDQLHAENIEIDSIKMTSGGKKIVVKQKS
jgi:DNA mismatch repair protein MutS